MSEIVSAVFSNTGLEKGLMDDGKDGFEVGASGDFGDNAAVSGKNVDLGNDHVTEEVKVSGGNFAKKISERIGTAERVSGSRRLRKNTRTFEDSGSGFVTRTFDSEDFHVVDYIIIVDMMQLKVFVIVLGRGRPCVV